MLCCWLKEDNMLAGCADRTVCAFSRRMDVHTASGYTFSRLLMSWLTRTRGGNIWEENGQGNGSGEEDMTPRREREMEIETSRNVPAK